MKSSLQKPIKTISGAFDWRAAQLDWPVTTEVGPGLSGVIACGTRVCWLEPTTGILAYRGIPVERIVGWGMSFEEVVYLLVTGRRPGEDPAALDALRRRLADAARLPPQVRELLDALPGCHPTRQLRVGVSALGCHELRAGDEISGASHWRDLRIVGQVAALVGEISSRLVSGAELAQHPDDSLAKMMLRSLTGSEPLAAEIEALELLWVLYADHGLDAPSFTSMIVASCHADPYYNVVAGLSALLGDRLGGVTEAVWQQLSALGSAAAAERWVDAALRRGERIAGFGHRLYRMPDPRAAVLHQAAARLAQARGEVGLLEVAEVVHRCAAARLAARDVHVNINFYAAVLFDLLGAPSALFPCLYAVGRMAGLVARVHEALERGRIYRPRCRYRSGAGASGDVASSTTQTQTQTQTQTYRDGLDGLVVGDSAISEIDGVAGELRYRGIPIDRLAATASFEQVACLVLDGTLPDDDALQRFREALWRWRHPPDEALAVLQSTPADAHPLALLRTMFTAVDCVAAGSWTPAQVLGWSAALGAAAIRHLRGEPPLADDGPLGRQSSLVERFLYYALGALPPEEDQRAFEVSLIVQSEHGLHAAALAALVVISTGADLGSAVLAGMGALSGARHGGANQLAHEMLAALSSPDEARAWVDDQLRRGGRFPGFGHRVYKCPDPRVRVLEPHAEGVLRRRALDQRWETYRALRERVEDALAGKGVFANIDSITGLIYAPLGLPAAAMSIPFCLGIQIGWMAHCLEYQQHSGPMIEPGAVYLAS